MNTIDTQQLINFLLQQQKSVKSISIEQLANLYYQKLKLNNRQGTLNSYKEAVKPLFKFFTSKGITTSEQVTNEVINEFIMLRKDNVKPQTINKAIINFKTMMNYALENEYIDAINFKFKKLKESKTEIPQIQKQDINKIINHFKNSKKDKKYKLAFLLMLTTGVRTTELLNIKNKNINLKEKTIKLDFTKNSKVRNIYIIDELHDLVKEQMNDTNYLFIDNMNQQMSANNLRLFFKRIKKELNIDILSPHKLRHYYATTLYKNSLDINLVSNLLGHSDVKMTQIYLDIDTKEHQQKNQLFNPLKSLDPLNA